MNIAKFQELTGLVVPASKQTFYTAQIRKSRIKLESLLGYSLLKSKASFNQYEELGKTSQDFGAIDGTLLAADTVINSYRLFPYNEKDLYFHIDPFTTIHAVKLVYVKKGDEPNGVTVKTYDVDEIRIQQTKGIKKYLQRVFEPLLEPWIKRYCSPDYSVQIAVDADWMNEECLPEELQDIWCDLVTYYADTKKDIKSETLGSHSYTRNIKDAPELLPENVTILRKYSGPNGIIHRVPVV